MTEKETSEHILHSMKDQKDHVVKEIADFDRISAMIQRSLQSELDELERKIAVRESIRYITERMGE